MKLLKVAPPALLLLQFFGSCSTVNNNTISPGLEARQGCMRELTSLEMNSTQDFLNLGDKRRQQAEAESTPEKKTFSLRCAIAAYEGATVMNPDEALAHIGLAEVYLQLGRPKLATECLKKVLSLAPTFSGARTYLNKLALEAGDKELAGKFLQMRARAAKK